MTDPATSLSGVIERLARGFRWLRASSQGGHAAAARPADSERPPHPTAEAPSEPIDPESIDETALSTRTDVIEEHGMRPPDLFRHILSANGGRMRQQEFDAYVDWSSSTTTRLLQEMEADGQIVRLQMGHEKIVFLPDETPDQTPAAANRPLGKVVG